MNRDKLLTALELLKKNGVLCYVYRESVFELLSMNRADGAVSYTHLDVYKRQGLSSPMSAAFPTSSR